MDPLFNLPTKKMNRETLQAKQCLSIETLEGCRKVRGRKFNRDTQIRGGDCLSYLSYLLLFRLTILYMVLALFPFMYCIKTGYLLQNLDTVLELQQ